MVAYGQEPREPPPEKKPAPRRTVSRSSSAPWRQKWEYSVLSAAEIAKRADGDLQAGLNRLGEEGWELVTVRTPDHYFKRATTPPMTGMMGGGGAGIGAVGGPDRRGFDEGGFGRGGFDRGGFGGGFGTSTGTRTDSGPRGQQGPPAVAGPRAAAPEKQSFHVIVLKHASAADLGTILHHLFQGTGARLVHDPHTNSLIVAGTEDHVRALRELVVQLDQPRREQKK
jgi:hypothetical protein